MSSWMRRFSSESIGGFSTLIMVPKIKRWRGKSKTCFGGSHEPRPARCRLALERRGGLNAALPAHRSTRHYTDAWSPLASRGQWRTRGLEPGQDLGPFKLGEVRRDVLFDLGAELRVQFVQQLVIDFLAGGQKEAFDMLAAGQGVEPLRQLAHQPPPRLQLDV